MFQADLNVGYTQKKKSKKKERCYSPNIQYNPRFFNVFVMTDRQKNNSFDQRFTSTLYFFFRQVDGDTYCYHNTVYDSTPACSHWLPDRSF